MDHGLSTNNMKYKILPILALLASAVAAQVPAPAPPQGRPVLLTGATLHVGNGTVIEHPCRTCRGSGRERATKRYTVKIPAGARDGTRIRLKGRGEPGRNGGPAGDLWVVTRVGASPLYERRGADLVVEVPLSYADLALGTSVDVPTPEGQISLKVPAGSQPGKLLRVKGRGAPKLKGGGKGDLLARLALTVPAKISKKERELLEELRKVSR